MFLCYAFFLNKISSSYVFPRKSLLHQIPCHFSVWQYKFLFYQSNITIASTFAYSIALHNYVRYSRKYSHAIPIFYTELAFTPTLCFISSSFFIQNFYHPVESFFPFSRRNFSSSNSILSSYRILLNL